MNLTLFAFCCTFFILRSFVKSQFQQQEIQTVYFHNNVVQCPREAKNCVGIDTVNGVSQGNHLFDFEIPFRNRKSVAVGISDLENGRFTFEGGLFLNRRYIMDGRSNIVHRNYVLKTMWEEFESSKNILRIQMLVEVHRTGFFNENSVTIWFRWNDYPLGPIILDLDAVAKTYYPMVLIKPEAVVQLTPQIPTPKDVFFNFARFARDSENDISGQWLSADITNRGMLPFIVEVREERGLIFLSVYLADLKKWNGRCRDMGGACQGVQSCVMYDADTSRYRGGIMYPDSGINNSPPFHSRSGNNNSPKFEERIVNFDSYNREPQRKQSDTLTSQKSAFSFLPKTGHEDPTSIHQEHVHADERFGNSDILNEGVSYPPPTDTAPNVRGLQFSSLREQFTFNKNDGGGYNLQFNPQPSQPEFQSGNKLKLMIMQTEDVIAVVNDNRTVFLKPRTQNDHSNFDPSAHHDHPNLRAQNDHPNSYPRVQNPNRNLYPTAQNPNFNSYARAQNPNPNPYPRAQNPNPNSYPRAQKPNPNLYPGAQNPNPNLYPGAQKPNPNLYPRVQNPNPNLYPTAENPNPNLYPRAQNPNSNLYSGTRRPSSNPSKSYAGKWESMVMSPRDEDFFVDITKSVRQDNEYEVYMRSMKLATVELKVTKQTLRSGTSWNVKNIEFVPEIRRSEIQLSRDYFVYVFLDNLRQLQSKFDGILSMHSHEDVAFVRLPAE